METLRGVLIEAAVLLEAHQYGAVATRLRRDERRLAAGERDALRAVLAEATGGAGSLRDIYLYPGDPADRERLNATLSSLVQRIARLAREGLQAP